MESCNNNSLITINPFRGGFLFLGKSAIIGKTDIEREPMQIFKNLEEYIEHDCLLSNTGFNRINETIAIEKPS